METPKLIGVGIVARFIPLLAVALLVFTEPGQKICQFSAEVDGETGEAANRQRSCG